ncbi:MAG: cadherin-like beta sandwich domain-containing protein [Gammaproteobacteria bacterium]|nr:cadherin-like beta sandwich domain-containing protein [Gammaproteobacteria bacterium]CAJ2376879.1 MAG: exported hypothetical protein [Arenicellales bacterium IbO2]MDA7961982.1 cadherin-like beta sandwich domain-containing protein [Gammaproteobacteria bacterium]MDA7972574.1 cadherin-like beta sandwich domain-containing protein [Gammaproteobacteria bacterium]MDA7996356.1 cadherin-like beta sandwich domain-containing protein [Gammaproteobacteria bacterium]
MRVLSAWARLGALLLLAAAPSAAWAQSSDAKLTRIAVTDDDGDLASITFSEAGSAGCTNPGGFQPEIACTGGTRVTPVIQLNAFYNSGNLRYTTSNPNATCVTTVPAQFSPAQDAIREDEYCSVFLPWTQKLPRVVTIVVTAPDGTTTLEYQVIVVRGRPSASENDATLSNLSLSRGAVLSPSFAAATTSYAARAPNSADGVAVTPTARNVLAAVTVDGTAVISGGTSGEIPLVVGEPKDILVEVDAFDGSASTTYTITALRDAPAPDNADLATLALSGGAVLSPSFNAATTSYTASVVDVGGVTVTSTPNDPNASVAVDGAAVAGGAASGEINLEVNTPKTITVVVTARDGMTTKTYKVTVTRAPSANANLDSWFMLGAGGLSEELSTVFFSTVFFEDFADVPNRIGSIRIRPTAEEANATITVNGVAVASGAASGEIALVAGVRKRIDVVVTAQNGVAKKTYTLQVLRQSDNADLAGLALSGGAVLSPQFGAATTSYAATVAHNNSGVTVTPTLSDSSAAVTVAGAAVASGAASGEIALVVNVPKDILVVVTAQDGTTTKTYTVTVLRSENTNLSALTLSGGAVLSPQFDAATVAYTVNVANSVSGLTFTPTTDDSNASVTVDGTAVASGAASGEIALVAGVPKAVLVVVTAQGGTMKTYTVTVTRSSLRFPAAQEDLTVRAGAPLPAPIALGAAEGGVPPLIYAVSNLPGGLSFNANRREISGTPSAAGEARVVYSVTDAAAARAETQFTIRAVIFDLDLDAATAETPQDGIIIARYLLGVRGELLVRGQSAAGNAAAFAAEIQKGVDSKALDVDADGEAGFADGIFIARYTLGLRGDDLVRGFDNKDAAEITGNIQNLRP